MGTFNERNRMDQRSGVCSMKKIFFACALTLVASSANAQAPFKVNGLISTGPIVGTSASLSDTLETFKGKFGTVNGSPALFTSESALSVQVNPTYSTTVTPGFLARGFYGGTVTSGQAFFNQIGADGDSVNASSAQGGGALLFYVGHTLSAGAVGGRTTLQANFNQLGSTTAAVGQYYVALSGFANASFSAGGSAGSLRGNLFGANHSALLKTGAGMFWNSAVGEEIDVGIQAGTSVIDKVGFKVVQWVSDAVHGTRADYAIGLNNQALGTAPGWNVGFAFGGPEGWWPISSTGTMLGTYAAVIGGGPSIAAAYGIDFSSVTFSTGFLKSTGFLVDGSGNVTGASYKAGAAVGVSCAAGTVSLATLVVTGGIVTHC